MAPAATAYVPKSLLDAIAANPERDFRVILQANRDQTTRKVVENVQKALNKSGADVTHQYGDVFAGASLTLKGKYIAFLARTPFVAAITPDAAVVPRYENAEMWRESVKIDSLWSKPAVTCALNLLGLKLDSSCVPSLAVLAPQAPAIAIVDSGIDESKAADFGGRVVASVNFSPDGKNDDLQGHGTMVAGVAAGASSAYPGVAQNAPLVDVRISDRNGLSYASDVIAGLDWILANKDKYNIRVVNMSISQEALSPFAYDPLNRAVERLWLNGITVVAAAGNHGTGSEVDMSHAPGNDPFVITVGAVDQHQTTATGDDTIAPWSAYGHTGDGFQKPEVSAPGRYLIMPVPADAEIAKALPERVTGPGYMWMSGTSFATPVVAGAAAQIRARNPSFTPDQV
jgi:serine protease AprX